MQLNRHVKQMGRISFGHIGMRLQDALPEVSPTVVRAIRHVFATGETVANLEVGAPMTGIATSC